MPLLSQYNAPDPMKMSLNDIKESSISRPFPRYFSVPIPTLLKYSHRPYVHINIMPAGRKPSNLTAEGKRAVKSARQKKYRTRKKQGLVHAARNPPPSLGIFIVHNTDGLLDDNLTVGVKMSTSSMII